MRTRFLTLIGALAVFASACGRPTDPPAPPSTPPTPTTLGSPPTIGMQIDDSIVTAKVKSAFLADPEVKGLDFQVDTRKGEVLLSGFVDSQAQIDRALAIARQIEGVRQVTNNVSIKTAGTTVGAVVDDAVVSTRVKTALLAEPEIKGLDIAVATRNGQVQLSGFVDSQEQIKRALDLVGRIEGVKSVSNEMSIKK